MKILITLSFNSPFGGLNDNVLATAIEAKDRGHDVYVACRSSEFLEYLKSLGIQTISVDDKSARVNAEKIIDKIGKDIDLIHCHPGISRIIGIHLHRQYKIPAIYHVHGKWTDGLEKCIDDFECVFAVSESVKSSIVELCGGYTEKIFVIPNYSDYEYAMSDRPKEDIISLISRLDKDKSVILEEFLKIVPVLNTTDRLTTINIIGDGKLRDEFVSELNESIQNSNVKVNFIGWINNKEVLKKHIDNSTIIIGPGRVAIDSLVLGKPVLVVGSNSYQGYITKNNWKNLIANNFGGYGKIVNTNHIDEDLLNILNSEEIYNQTIKLGTRIIKSFFDKNIVLEKHFDIYEIVSKSNNL